MTDFTERQLKLIEQYRDINVDEGSMWSDDVIGGFVEACNELGLCVQPKNVQFSGFWSQGDGASFTFESDNLNAVLECATELVEKHKDTLPEEGTYRHALWSLAHDLVQALEKYRLLGQEFIDDVLGEASICAARTGHHYSHSGTVTAEFNKCWTRLDEDDPRVLAFLNDLEGIEVDKLVEAIADALYRELEESYDYLTSDEVVWDAIVANELDELDEEDEEDEEELEWAA